MKLQTQLAYAFDELSPHAKDRARDRMREFEAQEFDADYVLDDFTRICEILGVTLATNTVRLHGGGTRQKPQIYWSGFCSQGDGASFFGTYYYGAQSRKKIRAYAPQDKTLHDIADTLADLQRRNFYQLSARITSNCSRYQHSNTMCVETYRDGADVGAGDVEQTIADTLRALADWLYKQLESAYDYAQSDESIDETIRANEYSYSAEGRML